VKVCCRCLGEVLVLGLGYKSLTLSQDLNRVYSWGIVPYYFVPRPTLVEFPGLSPPFPIYGFGISGSVGLANLTLPSGLLGFNFGAGKIGSESVLNWAPQRVRSKEAKHSKSSCEWFGCLNNKLQALLS